MADAELAVHHGAMSTLFETVDRVADVAFADITTTTWEADGNCFHFQCTDGEFYLIPSFASYGTDAVAGFSRVATNQNYNSYTYDVFQRD